MRARLLGTAAGGGVPQWNCACSNCAAARSGGAPYRTVAALAVSADDGKWVLVNASCDISGQLAAASSLWPNAGRSSPIVSVLLTDANVDHTAGILEFRQANALSIYSTQIVKDVLCASRQFEQLTGGHKHWNTFTAGRRVRVDVSEAPQLHIYATLVPGLLPSYAGGGPRDGATVAYIFEHQNKRLVYAPIFLRIDDGLSAGLVDADALFLDGTCWSDNELIELGLGQRTSRAMGHLPISGVGGSLELGKGITASHRYYTHINNSNPILNPASAPARMVRESGFTIPEDGLEIDFDGNGAQN